jgi:hypothetical protein
MRQPLLSATNRLFDDGATNKRDIATNRRRKEGPSCQPHLMPLEQPLTNAWGPGVGESRLEGGE